MFAVFDLAQLPLGHHSSKGTVHTSHFPHIYLVPTIDKSPLASDLSRAQCSPFPAPSGVPRLHTLLATLAQLSPDRGGHIQSLVPCGGVRDPLRRRSPSSWSGSPFTSPSAPHLHAALAIRERRVPKPGVRP